MLCSPCSPNCNVFVLDTPICTGKSSSGWQRTSSTGIAPPVGSLQIGCPHCLRPHHPEAGHFTLGLWLDTSLIISIAGHGHAESCPTLIANWNRSIPGGGKHADYLSLLLESCCSILPVYPGAVANVAYAHHNSNRIVPDE